MDSVKKKGTNMIDFVISFKSLKFYNDLPNINAPFSYLKDISLYFIFIGIDEFSFIHFGKVCIWLIKKRGIILQKMPFFKNYALLCNFSFSPGKLSQIYYLYDFIHENALKFY